MRSKTTVKAGIFLGITLSAGMGGKNASSASAPMPAGEAPPAA
jgi:hypothetical protein